MLSVSVPLFLWNHIQEEFNRFHRSDPSFPEHYSRRVTKKEEQWKWERGWKITLHVSAIRHGRFWTYKGLLSIPFYYSKFEVFSFNNTLRTKQWGFSRNYLAWSFIPCCQVTNNGKTNLDTSRKYNLHCSSYDILSVLQEGPYNLFHRVPLMFFGFVSAFSRKGYHYSFVPRIPPRMLQSLTCWPFRLSLIHCTKSTGGECSVQRGKLHCPAILSHAYFRKWLQLFYSPYHNPRVQNSDPDTVVEV